MERKKNDLNRKLEHYSCAKNCNVEYRRKPDLRK